MKKISKIISDLEKAGKKGMKWKTKDLSNMSDTEITDAMREYSQEGNNKKVQDLSTELRKREASIKKVEGIIPPEERKKRISEMLKDLEEKK